MAKPAKTMATEIAALFDIEALDRCTRGWSISVGISETFVFDSSFLNRWLRFVFTCLLEQVPVIMDETRRLETPGLVKRVEKMREAAFAVGYAINRCPSFARTFVRGVKGVFHQTTRSRGETDRGILAGGFANRVTR
jgi:hypothetical protein